MRALTYANIIILYVYCAIIVHYLPPLAFQNQAKMRQVLGERDYHMAMFETQ